MTKFRTVVGLIEKVKINNVKLTAKIDTGAKYNSICRSMVKKCKLKPRNKSVEIKSALGKQKRMVVRGKLRIKRRTIITNFNITDRTNMKYPILIGWKTLKEGFLIDPSEGEKN